MRVLNIALCLLATPALADVAGVASVIDGDTIEVHGQRIRFHGIDAPESRCGAEGQSSLAGDPGCVNDHGNINDGSVISLRQRVN